MMLSPSSPCISLTRRSASLKFGEKRPISQRMPEVSKTRLSGMPLVSKSLPIKDTGDLVRP